MEAEFDLRLSDQLKPEFMLQPAQQMFADNFSLLPRRPHVYLPNCPMMQQERRLVLSMPGV